MAIQEEEVLGKAYDARLMRRLLTYLHKYRWQVTVALIAIVLKAVLMFLGRISPKLPSTNTSLATPKPTRCSTASSAGIR